MELKKTEISKEKMQEKDLNKVMVKGLIISFICITIIVFSFLTSKLWLELIESAVVVVLVLYGCNLIINYNDKYFHGQAK